MKSCKIYGLFILATFSIATITAQGSSAPVGKTITIDGLQLYYEESGSGMPLILLHPFGGTSGMWRPFASEFSKEYRVIAIDLPGHGRSDYMDTTNVYLHKRATGYMLGLIDSLQLDSVNIVGASAGGFIALYIATQRPALAKNIIIIGGQTYFSAQARKAITDMGSQFEKQPELHHIFMSHGPVKGNLLQAQFWHFRKLYGDPNFTPDVLANITARALIIHGDNDPAAPVSNAWEMYNHIDKSSLWVVPDGGHMPHLIPDNHDEFVRRTMAFLKQGK